MRPDAVAQRTQAFSRKSRTGRSSTITIVAFVIALLAFHVTQPAFGSEEIVVTAARQNLDRLELTGNTAKLDAGRITLNNAQHIAELGSQLAGTWISRGSGQEHLTAIRSAVLTGAGACGAFLVLEDGIPTRPTGFCNTNQLFELPSELAQTIEVLRGPSNALYGSNGLHGTINVILDDSNAPAGWSTTASVGADQYLRGKLAFNIEQGNNAYSAGLVADHYDGFRDSSGYEQQKGFARWRTRMAGGDLALSFSGQHLNQDTAGFVLGQDAYKDDVLRTTNPNPEAFRNADSQRVSARWAANDAHPFAGLQLRVYARRSQMEFLQHFIPGQPLEENGQLSGGIMALQSGTWGSANFTAGLDIEVMDGYLEQFQQNALSGPSLFLNATLPQGAQYDFDVNSVQAAPYIQLSVPLSQNLDIETGLRAEYLRYDYDNNLLDGNTRDDGTACGFGGCRYSRPADRSDSFFNVAPMVALRYQVSPFTTLYTSLSRGFRAPQATELYRLQNDQSIADLDTVILDSAEVGLQRVSENIVAEANVFLMRKRNDIFQDVDRNNISSGRSKHYGIEVQADIDLPRRLYAGIAATWARHRYDFSLATPGEQITSGNDIDTAPRTLASAHIGWRTGQGELELQILHHGAYWIDAANERKYEGHDLLNLRGAWQISERWRVAGRINNLLDSRYADRADFAFGNFRYFPGREREYFIDLSWKSR